MILQTLVSYYEELARKDLIPKTGWSKVRVQFALEIDGDGKLLSVLPLEAVNEKGKPIPRYFYVPKQMKRAGTRAPAYFLCDNSQYCLGLEKGQVTEKSLRCFAIFCEYHRKLLSQIDSACAKALINFINRWDPTAADHNQPIVDQLNAVSGGGNFVFMLRGADYVHEDPQIVALWNGSKSEEEAVIGRCLVNGEVAEIARIHNSVRGIRTNNLSPNGWTLIGFDKDAFCSYGKTQSFNAPVSKYAENAYTVALNHLLSDSDHTISVGDSTVVYWAENAEPQYQDAFGCFLGGATMTDRDMKGVMERLAKGKDVDWGALPLRADNRFYVLGLAPNAARLSVRFFLRDTFGGFAAHLDAHYQRLEIVRPGYDKDAYLPLWKLLRETVNPNARDKSASPQMAGDTLRAILTGGRYPATLYQQTMLRIKAEHEVTRGKAAIIKAILIRNTDDTFNKEALTVELNEKTTYQPYVLGRMFSILEAIQQAANPGVNTTIKDKYFTSACATPATVFPTLMNLAEKHLRKMSVGSRVFYAKQLGALTEKIDESYPVHLTLFDQGVFQLGYYHQTQKRYEKRTSEKSEEER